MSDIKTLKSYLVSLGFNANMGQFHSQFEKPLKEASSLIRKETFGITADFIKWQAGITGVFAGITTAILGTMDKVAMADQDYRLFGERMFMDTAHAKGLKIALDALGEPLEAIAFDPELHDRFIQLQMDQKQMQAGLGIDFEKNMRSIRDVNFEFTRFKVELQYLAMGASNSIFKALGMDSGDLLTNLRHVNDWIIKNIPELSDKFAHYLVPVLKDTYRIFSDLWELVKIGASVFTNLIGLLSGDTSIMGTATSFDSVAKAVEHVIGWLDKFVNYMAQAEKMLLHFTNAAVLASGGHMTDAKNELTAGLKQLTPGSGAITGVSVGSAIGGAIGGTLGIAGGPLGILGGGSTGATVGGALGAATGWSAGKINDAETSGKLDYIKSLSLKISKDTGIPANFIFDQWAHETNDFSNRGAKSLNNLAGIRNSNHQYVEFSDLDQFAKVFEQVITSKRYRSQGILGATTLDQYAASLKAGGYYEDSLSNYTNGLKYRDKEYSGTVSIDNSTGDITVHVTQPNASADDIANAVQAKVQARQGTQTQRNFSQLQSVHP